MKDWLAKGKDGDSLDQVPLGLEFPESVREIVGEDWWERNQSICMEAGLDVAEEVMEVELF